MGAAAPPAAAPPLNLLRPLPLFARTENFVYSPLCSELHPPLRLSAGSWPLQFLPGGREVRYGTAQHRTARHSMAWLGSTWHRRARLGSARHDIERLGTAQLGTARLGSQHRPRTSRPVAAVPGAGRLRAPPGHNPARQRCGSQGSRGAFGTRPRPFLPREVPGSLPHAVLRPRCARRSRACLKGSGCADQKVCWGWGGWLAPLLSPNSV